LSVFCWLDALEKRLKADGTLSDTLYYQVDGGPEAMCSLALCVAEFLVAKGLCKRVVVTRLPVGHTHEDIDSLFAKIWKKLRRMHVITPQQYAKLAAASLYKAGRPCKVEDVFCVPDFQSFIADACGDKAFSPWKSCSLKLKLWIHRKSFLLVSAQLIERFRKPLLYIIYRI
jgi:hypothetical protein